MNEEQRKCQVQVQQRKWPKESKFRYQNHDWRQELRWRKNYFKPLIVKQCLSVWPVWHLKSKTTEEKAKNCQTVK